MTFQGVSMIPILVGIAGLSWIVGHRIVRVWRFVHQKSVSEGFIRLSGMLVFAIPVFFVLFLPRGLHHREWALGTMTALLGFWFGSRRLRSLG